MFETVTVDEALEKGRRMVNVPVIAILVIAPVVAVGLTATKLLPAWSVAVMVPVGFLLAWLYWSMTVPKWKVWAFDSVRNVHELKKRAIQDKLIWPDGHLLGKTEIWTAADKEAWAGLQKKFEQEDIFHDDLSVESETLIYYSKAKLLGLAALMLLVAGVGVFLLVAKTDNNLLAYGLIAVGLVVAVLNVVNALNKKPQIVLNEQGMATKDVLFNGWKDISNEEAIRVQRGKNSSFYLVYDHPTGKVKLDIGSLGINRKELNKLLRIYRGRYTKALVGPGLKIQ